MRERTSADITIYGTDGQSIVTVPITAGSKRVVKLMESDYIQLSFSLDSAVYIPVGAYCDDPIFGRFCVTEEQMPRYNTSTGGYDYDLRLDAWYYMWNLKQMMLIRNLPSDDSIARCEGVWYLTWSLKEQMRQFMRNLQLLGYVADTYDFVDSSQDASNLDMFVKIDSDTVPKATEALTMSYNGTHLLDALKAIADTWECEYWITGTEGAFEIHFGKCESGTLQTISLATNAQNITANNDVSERGDKLYYFGGLDNIPNTYRKQIELVASDVTDSDSDNFVNTFRAVDRNGKYAKLTMEHFGGEKWTGLSGYMYIKPDVEASPSVTTFSTIGGAELINALRDFVFYYTGHTAASLPLSAMLPAVPGTLIIVHLYIDYIDLTDDPTAVITEEVNTSIINDCASDPDVAIQRIYFVAENATTVAQVPLEVSQWRNIALQTKDDYNNVYILSIGDNTEEDAGGVYITAYLGSVYGAKLYINQTTSTIEWSSLAGLARYEFNWEDGNGKYLYDDTLIMIRHTADIAQVPSEAQYLLEYDFYYLNSGVFSQIYTGEYTYPLFSGYLTGYYVTERYTPTGQGADITYLLGFADNYVVQQNVDTLNLVTTAQTLKIALSVGAEYMDNLFWHTDAITFTPEVFLSLIDASVYTTKKSVMDYVLANGVGALQLTDPTLQYVNLPQVTLYRKDFELRNGNYYIEYSVALPALSVNTDWNSQYVSAGYYPVFAARVPVHSPWIEDVQVMEAYSASFREIGKQSVFLARLKDISTAQATDYVFEFCQWTPWMPTVNAFPNGTVFRIAEYTPEMNYSATLWNVPYAYWVDDLDDPASLLSIGDKRLQLPVYDATEFNTYKTTGMTYENGYIVKNGMAYKNGYIIPYDMIGDDDNRALRELTVTNDNVYPDGKLLVKTVKKVDAVEKVDVEGQSQRLTWSYKQYHLQLRLPNSQNVFDFSRDYILPNGEPLKIRFLVPEDVKEYYESGAISAQDWATIQSQCKLAGMQFAVAYNDEITYQADDEGSATQHTEDVWIERNDDFGAKLPSEILFPQVLDPCVLVNWNVMALSALGLVARAEYKLLDKAFEYYAALRDGNFTFTADMMSDWLYDIVGGLQLVTSDWKNVIDSNGDNVLVKNEHEVYAIPSLGQRVMVQHAALKDGYKDTRIIGVEMKLDKPYDTPKLTIGETEAYSRLKQMEKEITKLSN